LVSKTTLCSDDQNRKEQVVLTRCYIGHDRFTYIIGALSSLKKTASFISY
jgi:hypothetical protein